MEGKYQDNNLFLRKLVPNTTPIEMEDRTSQNKVETKTTTGTTDESLNILENNETMLNSIQFYCDVMYRSGPGVLVVIDNLFSFANKLSVDVKTATSVKELTEFLSQYPQIFNVHENNVILKNWIVFHFNQRVWLQEVLSRYSSVEDVGIFISAIQFYSNVIFTCAPKFKFTVRELFRYKRTAPEAIKSVTKNITAFKCFLHQFPEIFIFKDDNVKLTKSALNYKSMNYESMVPWINQLVSDINKTDSKKCNFPYSTEVFIRSSYRVNDYVTIEAIEFYYKILWEHGTVEGLSINNLLSKKRKASPVVKEITKTKKELHDFLSNYPQLFRLSNNMVILTHLLENVNCAELKCYDEKQSTSTKFNCEKFSIAYYSEVLKKLSLECNEVMEFPISHVYLYSVDAPPEVKEVATNVVELKSFFLKFPNIFKIIGDNVVHISEKSSNISKNIEQNESPRLTTSEACIAFEQTVKEAINFYSDIILKFGKVTTFQQLLDCRRQSNEKVRNIATTLEELRTFLSAYPDIFTVEENRVFIHRNKLGEQMEGKNVEKEMLEKRFDENIKNKVFMFYADYLNKNKRKSSSISRMMGYRSCAPPDVQVYIKNPSELKAFLSQFPEDFTIVDTKNHSIVTLSNYDNLLNQEWVSSGVSCKDSLQVAVDFFSKMLKECGFCRVLSIDELFELKLKSPPNIQKITGSNIYQFKTFLMQYPNYFIVTSENVIGKKIVPKWSYSRKYENRRFTDPLLIVIFNFFRKYTQNKTLFHINYLYKHAGRYFLHCDKTPIFPTTNDLLLFFALYTHDFYVDYSRVMNIVSSCKRAYISSNKFKKTKKKSPEYSNSKLEYKKSVKNPIVSSKVEPILNEVKNILLDSKKISEDDLSESNKENINKTEKLKVPKSIVNGDNLIETLDKRLNKKAKNNVKRWPKKRIIKRTIDDELLSLDSNNINNGDTELQYQFDLSNYESLGNNKENVNKTEKLMVPNCVVNGDNLIETLDKCLGKKATNKDKHRPQKAIIEKTIDDGLLSLNSNIINRDTELQYQFDISNYDSLGNKTLLGEKQYSKERIQPPNIEKIEENVFSRFTLNVSEDHDHQKYARQQNAEVTCVEKVFVNQNMKLKNYDFPKSFKGRRDYDTLTKETLIFLNNLLWNSGRLQIFEIEELFIVFSQTPLEICNYYCRNLKEFKHFLSKFTKDFLISKNYVMALKNRIEKQCYIENSEEDSLTLMFFNFFDSYTQSNNYLDINLLYKQVGRYFCTIKQLQIFNCPEELVLFLEMFPDVFYIDNNFVINLTGFRESKSNNVNYTIEKNKNYSLNKFLIDIEQYIPIDIPELAENWKDYVLQKTQLIEDINESRRVTDSILKSEKVIALDCEGVNLGAAGILTLVQIGLANGKVYIFDIIKDKSIIEGGLRDILECEFIVKVIHDCRNDVANLYTEYGVQIKNIFDTRIAHHLIINGSSTVRNHQCYKPTAIGYNELCSKYGIPINIEKDEIKHVYKKNYMFWKTRPLTNDMMAYAALDVASLVPHLFCTMFKQLQGKSKTMVWEMSSKYSVSILNVKELLFYY